MLMVALARRCDGFVIVGYVPEYRFNGLDWDGVAARTTHLVLFSAEPTADGDLSGLDRFWLLRQSSSPLRLALKRAGSGAPKVLISIGGIGRSTHFAPVCADKKLRRRLARRIVQLLVEYPTLSGIDLNWDAPKGVDEWRNLAKLAHDVRERMAGDDGVPIPGTPMLTMSFHPLTGAVAAFAGLKGKGSGKTFVEHFDLCHAMSYSLFDEHQRHATQRGSKMAVDEWAGKGLPASRLTLGLPFFAISRTTSQGKGYHELLDQEPTLKDRLDADEAADGYYFNNANTLAKKVRFAKKRQLAGVMIWELGQDKAPSKPGGGSLLRHVWDAAVAVSDSPSDLKKPGSLWSDILAKLPVTEDNVVCGLAGIAGAYLLLKALWFHTPVRDRAPRGENDPPKEPSEEHLRIVKESEERYEREEREYKKKSGEADGSAEAAEAPGEGGGGGETEAG